MSDGMSEVYGEEQEWKRAIKQLKEAEDLALKDEEYKNLVDAHIAISILIKQQAKKYTEIQDRRMEILKKYETIDSYGLSELLTDLDFDRERNIIQSYILRNLG